MPDLIQTGHQLFLKATYLTGAAEAAGLTYHYLPVISGSITPEQVQQMAALVQSASGPVLAFCRSGARSTQLWMMGSTTD